MTKMIAVLLLVCIIGCNGPTSPTPSPTPSPPAAPAVEPTPQPPVPSPESPAPPPAPAPTPVPTPGYERFALIIEGADPRFPLKGAPQLWLRGTRADLGDWTGELVHRDGRTFLIRFGNEATLSAFDSPLSGWRFAMSGSYGSAWGSVEED